MVDFQLPREALSPSFGISYPIHGFSGTFSPTFPAIGKRE
jgi:hypothetical protein